jgi:hypothetical protein
MIKNKIEPAPPEHQTREAAALCSGPSGSPCLQPIPKAYHLPVTNLIVCTLFHKKNLLRCHDRQRNHNAVISVKLLHTIPFVGQLKLEH